MKKGGAVLKKVVDGLRCVPAALGGLAFLAVTPLFIAGVTTAIIYGNKADSYTETAVYQQVKAEEVAEVERAYKEGEIGEYDYNKKRTYMDSDKYTYELISRDYPENEEYQGYLKVNKVWSTVAIVSPIVALASAGLTSLYINFSGVEEAYDRLRLNNYDIVIEDKPKKQSKDKDLDYVEEGEALPNIEDSYYKE